MKQMQRSSKSSAGAVFLRIRRIEKRSKINEKSSLQLKELSMGMSNDYLLAVEKGATMIRLGSIIFGARN